MLLKDLNSRYHMHFQWDLLIFQHLHNAYSMSNVNSILVSCVNYLVLMNKSNCSLLKSFVRDVLK
jgi:hypothetical protein